MPGDWTRREIESLADPCSFLRGVGYQRGGRVEIGDRHGDAVTALVRGSMPYQSSFAAARRWRGRAIAR